MSRSRFVSLPDLRAPAAWPRARRRAAAPAAALPLESAGRRTRLDAGSQPDRPDDLSRARQLGRRGTPGPPPVTVLRLQASMQLGTASQLTAAVLARVRACRREVGTVVLDLGAGTEIDARGCAALADLHERLRTAGTGLRVVAAARQARDLFQETGLAGQLGARFIHPTLRAAVLATYAALPGPGLVTAATRAALDRPAEPVWLPAAGPPEQMLHPVRMGRAAGGGCWTVLARDIP
jgi:anti-anti-sigma regulatory factor